MAVLSLTHCYWPYTVTVEASSFSRMLPNVTAVAEDGLGWMRSCFIAGGTVIAYVEAEGIGASGTRVAESDIKRRRDRAIRHLL